MYRSLFDARYRGKNLSDVYVRRTTTGLRNTMIRERHIAFEIRSRPQGASIIIQRSHRYEYPFGRTRIARRCLRNPTKYTDRIRSDLFSLSLEILFDRLGRALQK